MKCPICDEGKLKKGVIEKKMFGVYLGKYPAEICDKCGESFTDSETMQKIEDAAKAKSPWVPKILEQLRGYYDTVAVRQKQLPEQARKEIKTFLLER